MAAVPVAAQQAADPVIATVNGRAIVPSDVRLAEAEIGNDLGSIPEPTRRRVLVEYLIETELMAQAAEQATPGQDAGGNQRLQYWRRKALRDSYFDSKVKPLVTEAEARRSFDAQLGGQHREVEVKAAHILLATEDKAKEVFEKISYGADFAEMAQKYSIDPGSKNLGGELGYFVHGQMVPQFEAVAFKLDRGEVSIPVKTQYGWHIIKVEDKRERRPPAFDAVKDRIAADLIHKKAQEAVARLRSSARVEYVDPEIKAIVDVERNSAQAR